MRAAFFGSPAFAIPCLEALNRIADIQAVFSQPDRPAGRGMSLRPPAVKVRAEELSLPVFQPKKVRNGKLAAQLRELELDVAVVVAYGRILPLPVLEAPRVGCVNVHASLLPRWRGAGPIQWSIASGDAETGVAVMAMDEGMDTGGVYATRAMPIGDTHTSASLAPELAQLGANLLEESLPQIVAGSLLAEPQPSEGITHARMLTKEDGRIDWSQDVALVHAHMRGMTPWPGPFTTRDGVVLKIHEATPTRAPSRGEPGEVIGVDERGILVACGTGVLAVSVLQPAGKKRLPAAAFLAGYGRPERFGN